MKTKTGFNSYMQAQKYIKINSLFNLQEKDNINIFAGGQAL